jgi:squalene-hopene/tetraprenyl-beta-curcumene cyclase
MLHAADASQAGVDDAIARSQAYLLGLQYDAGYWHAPLEANVGMDAQYIIFNRFVGRRPQETEQRLVARMLATQSDDGSWPLYVGGPGHLSTTIEAYFGCKLAGISADHPSLVKARAFIHARGGLAAAGVFTRTFLAYFGQFPWWGLPAMPVELNLLPPWFPINIYAMSSWARETVVPLTVLMALQPTRPLDPGCGVEELWLAPPTPDAVGFKRSDALFTVRNAFLALDRVLNFLGKSAWKPLRARAMKRAEEWILARQDVNGGWGGIQPPMINCVMALKALGHPDDHPAVAKGMQAIDDFLYEHQGQLFFQPCVSPTWDTALAAKALLDSGMSPKDPALVRAAEWLIDNQIFVPGDWSVYNPDLEPGGWAFEFANDWYPDTDDSAVILMVLQRVAVPDEAAKRRAMASGVNWTLGMQSRNGGWGAFDTNNDAEFLNRIPFADMEAMIDPPTEDLTGRLLELMGNVGFDRRFNRARRALAFVHRTQRPDGSWWGRWGANFIYGTWSVLSGLRAIGEDLDAPYIRRAVAWLKAFQNADGGWDEHLFTGTGFPRHFYLRYWMYRDYFPLMALGIYRARLEGSR